MKNSAGTTIAGSVGLTNGNLATFDPQSSLVASTTYTATLSTGIKDIAGNALTPAKSWSFTTAAASDTTPPTVTSTNPASGANGFPIASSITATFSEAIQPATVTTSTFTLKNSAGTTIAGSVALTNGNLVTFDPQSSLVASTTYTATLSTGIKDIAGNALTTAKSWSFTTAGRVNIFLWRQFTTRDSHIKWKPKLISATNAIDNNLNTRWYSTFIVNPWIQVDLGVQKSVCSVDIAWTDGASRQYSFQISVSTDGSSYTNIFSGKSSGTTASPQKYNFPETQARYVKITITQSHIGSASSLAQISEIDVFGKASSTSASTAASYFCFATTVIHSSVSNFRFRVPRCQRFFCYRRHQ